MNTAHNIYIHVPFCLSKCNYCAFFSVCSEPDWIKYTDSICSELAFWSQKLGNVLVPTIFFGGGTPSLIPINCFEKIMQCISDCFHLAKDCEITLEANPGTIDEVKLKEFIRCGVNRLSIGVQSLSDEELVFLGRKHTVDQALNLINIVQNMDIRLSADFIYGLPRHDVKHVETLCKNINALQLKHVSMYELTIEPNTPFGKRNLSMPKNETMADMYTVISQTLNLNRYEISNYCKKGEECRHNKNIWSGKPYIGIGKAAAGRPCINGVWYDQLGNGERFERLDINTRAVEKIITGMRTIEGVKLDEVILNLLNMDWIKNNSKYVTCQNGYLCATQEGMLLLDNILTDIIK
ncbi:MAG: radical SAM family heme chaperone HemW [Alphaproteobacteria bacterium]|nr:radical SAM family heme chaperone HemW [Alphaproteobacteria bacterium]